MNIKGSYLFVIGYIDNFFWVGSMVLGVFVIEGDFLRGFICEVVMVRGFGS